MTAWPGSQLNDRGEEPFFVNTRSVGAREWKIEPRMASLILAQDKRWRRA
jgi:hypothetical protein